MHRQLVRKSPPVFDAASSPPPPLLYTHLTIPRQYPYCPARHLTKSPPPWALAPFLLVPPFLLQSSHLRGRHEHNGTDSRRRRRPIKSRCRARYGSGRAHPKGCFLFFKHDGAWGGGVKPCHHAPPRRRLVLQAPPVGFTSYCRGGVPHPPWATQHIRPSLPLPHASPSAGYTLPRRPHSVAFERGPQSRAARAVVDRLRDTRGWGMSSYVKPFLAAFPSGRIWDGEAGPRSAVGKATAGNRETGDGGAERGRGRAQRGGGTQRPGRNRAHVTVTSASGRPREYGRGRRRISDLSSRIGT